MNTKTTASKTPAPAARRGLGRGLSALIPESDLDLLSGVARGDAPSQPVSSPATAKSKTASKANKPQSAKDAGDASGVQTAVIASADGVEVRYLALGEIEPNPFQPRQIFSEQELNDLADSLREHGVLQPILVRPLTSERFQLIAGERRWRAAQRAELKHIPAVVRDVNDQAALELAIIENVQRHDISPIEAAQAYRRLSQEFGLSQERIAVRVGKSRASVANTMRLLDLPEEAIEALRVGKLSEGHGRALLTAGDEAGCRALLRRTLRDELSVREVERLAREVRSTGVTDQNETVSPSPSSSISLTRANTDVTRLQESLQRTLGLRVHIRARRRGGQLVLNYSSPEELQRIVNKLAAKGDDRTSG